MSKQSKVLTAASYYATLLAGWPKAAGPKPTAAHFEQAHASGLRPGSAVAFANALMYRDNGMTRAELAATGTRPQFVAMAALEAAGIVKRLPAENRDGQMVYRLALTAKGNAKAAKASKADAGTEAPAKVAKAASKPRKAKVKATAADTTSQPSTADGTGNG